MHTPVLLHEAIEALQVEPGGKYIDATFGVGGHTNEILKRGGMVLAIDWDEGMTEDGRLKMEDGKLKLVHGNFAEIETIAKENGFDQVDGILLDLGISMEQIGSSKRGFSYKRLDEPLDMRISQNLTETAADIVNSYSINELYEVFAKGAEELASLGIARAIERARTLKKITHVGDLVLIVEKLGLGKKQTEAILRRIFQALRIEVNNEFDNLKKALGGARNIIKQNGRIVVITFHPGEDRIVKRFVRDNDRKLLTKKEIVGTRGYEFERSAKLRIII